jgi:RNase P protein component
MSGESVFAISLQRKNQSMPKKNVVAPAKKAAVKKAAKRSTTKRAVKQHVRTPLSSGTE